MTVVMTPSAGHRCRLFPINLFRRLNPLLLLMRRRRAFYRRTQRNSITRRIADRRKCKNLGETSRATHNAYAECGLYVH